MVAAYEDQPLFPANIQLESDYWIDYSTSSNQILDSLQMVNHSRNLQHRVSEGVTYVGICPSGLEQKRADLEGLYLQPGNGQYGSESL